MMWLFFLLTTVIFHEIDAITLATKDKDDLHLNTIQEPPGNTKDGTGNETQEKRTFTNPEVDRKGSFYPSGPNFAVGTSVNVGNNGYTPNYHTSGNGYSYGAPGNPEYPPVLPSGAPNFSERNYNFGSAPNFGHSGPGFGYGAPNLGNTGGSGYGAPNVGNSGYGAPNLGNSGGSGYGAPSLGGGGFGIMSHHGGGQHPLKGLLFPIAGFALLGAAAALAKSHPVLLQLGVIHGRKRRSVYPANPFLNPHN